MPGFFGRNKKEQSSAANTNPKQNTVKRIRPSLPYRSSINHADGQSIILTASTISTAQTINNQTMNLSSSNLAIVEQFIQIFINSKNIFSSETKTLEKVVNGVQGVNSGARLIVSSIILFKQISCSNNDNVLCKLAFFLRMINLGLGIAGFASAHITLPDKKTLITKRIPASKSFHNAQRINMASTFLSSGVITPLTRKDQATGQTVAPYIEIPTKIAQMIACIYIVFNKDSSLEERIVCGFQLIVCLAQLGIQTASLFKDEVCDNSLTYFCTANVYLQLLYLGLVIISLINAEIGTPSTNKERIALLKKDPLSRTEEGLNQNSDHEEEMSTISNQTTIIRSP